MDTPTLTGVQKSLLRSLGQTLEPALKVGQGGLTPEFFKEFGRQLSAQELIKLRFLGGDRPTRAKLIAKLTETTGCMLAGTVGHTALFYRPHPDAAKRKVLAE
jgi:RNA-binding protein